MSRSRVVIIGGGVAGVTVARTLASKQPKGQTDSFESVIFSQEDMLYYYRPKLPDYVGGKIGKEDLVAYPESWYREQGIDYRSGMVVGAIDVSAQRIRLAEGNRNETDFAYDYLVLATGGLSFVPPMPGHDRPGVFCLRTVADADAIRAYIAKNAVANAVLIGGGLLGLESAVALASLGLKVTVLEVADWLLPRQLDFEGAQMLAKKLSAMGIETRVGVRVEGFTGGDSVHLSVNGQEMSIPAELAIISAGAVPNTELARKAGLQVARGVVVDHYMTASDSSVYAVGDVAEHQGRTWGIVSSAIDQARVAASHMAIGEDTPPYKGSMSQTTLKVVGVDVTSIGDISGESMETITKSDSESGIYRKLFVRENKLVGAILMGTRVGLAPISKAISAGQTMESSDWTSLLA